MSNTHKKHTLTQTAVVALMTLLGWQSQAAVPGISGPSFDLIAKDGYITQPDGASVYSWGYGCNAATTAFMPTTLTVTPRCPSSQMQLPGPTLIVTQGQTVTVTLHNSLPAAAGSTSILFPGFTVTATGGAAGLLAQEAAPGGGTVTYTFVAKTPGTHSYYSGTQGDLQIEMGMYGALIVLPSSTPAVCDNTQNDNARKANRSTDPKNPEVNADFRLAHAAYNNSATCYDREYLFQFSEMDPVIHAQVEQQKGLPCADPRGCMVVQTEPYKPAYFMINGRSMPDDMDPNYASQYPLQPYNGNPHMHPGELTLLRIIGQGRMQHPFHEHANHVRVLARDGNLQLTKPQSDPTANLAGPLLFTTTTTPGQTIDGLFEWTGKNLNWDVYAHNAANPSACKADPWGYNTGITLVNGAPQANPNDAAVSASNYYEWCGDHLKGLESKPFGDVAGGGPVTLPDANILTNGAWYGGSPYLGPDATARAVGLTPIPPSGTVANDPGGEAGFAYMWHSHNEREITTSNIFPGGMMMMMLVDPWVFSIDESN